MVIDMTQFMFIYVCKLIDWLKWFFVYRMLCILVWQRENKIFVYYYLGWFAISGCRDCSRQFAIEISFLEFYLLSREQWMLFFSIRQIELKMSIYMSILLDLFNLHKKVSPKYIDKDWLILPVKAPNF